MIQRRADKLPVLSSGVVALEHVSVLEVVLENGQRVCVRPSDETYIPEDRAGLLKALREAASKYAFWSYQAARAEAAMKRLDTQVRKEEGVVRRVYRQWLTDQLGQGAFTESSVTSHVDSDDKVVEGRHALTEVELHYGLIRSLRDAADRRIHIIRTLVASYNNPAQ